MLIYLAYRGCYSKPNLEPSSSSTSMTIGFCAQVCNASSETLMAGISDMDCFCFNSVKGFQLLSNRHCRTKCPGDFSQVCGGNGALSVINLDDKSVEEVLVLYGDNGGSDFLVLNSNIDLCSAAIPRLPEENLRHFGWTTRKDRYFIICGGCDCTSDCDPNMCIGKYHKVNSLKLHYMN